MRISCLLLALSLLLGASAVEAAQPPSSKPTTQTAGQPALPKPAAAESALPEGVPRGTILGKNLWETFLAGGALMWPILLCSLIGLAFAIERAVSLREKVVIPQGLADKVQATLRESGPGATLRLCNERPSSLSRVLAAGLAAADAPREEVVAAMEESGERELWRLNRFAKPLNIITGVAPLLGLLGTVQGMIMAFDVVAQKGAMGDPRQLAAGIATALLTTFAGLTVAIPCYCLYHYFRDKTDHMFVEIEEAATHVVRALKGSANHAHPPSSSGG